MLMEIELSQFYSRLGTIALILLLGFLLGKLKLISKKTNQEITNLLLVISNLRGGRGQCHRGRPLNMLIVGSGSVC